MSNIITETFFCNDCGAEFTIEHDENEYIDYCPVCGSDLESNENMENYMDEDLFTEEDD